MTVTTGARVTDSCCESASRLLLEEGVRVVELGGQRGVAHFLDDDHRRLLVELLVDGDHLAQLHQLLDDLGGLDRHLVRRGRRPLIVSGMWTSCAWNSAGGDERSSARRRCGRRGGRRAARASRRGRRAGAARRGLEGALLGGVVGPARASFSDLIDFLSPGLGDRAGAAVPGRARLLVDRALDRFLGRLGRLGFSPASWRRAPSSAPIIIVRIAAASSSAALRRLARSAARCFSSFSIVPALTTRNAGLTGSAGGRLAAGSRRASALLQRRCCLLPWPLRAAAARTPAAAAACGASAAASRLRARASAASRSARSCSSRWRRCSCELFFLDAQALGLGVGLFLAAAQLGLVRLGARPASSTGAAASSRLTKVRFLRTSTWIVRALPLESACLISLVDLRVSVIFLRSTLRGRAVRGAQVIEQARLVALGHRVVGRRLADAGRLQLLEQRRGGRLSSAASWATVVDAMCLSLRGRLCAASACAVAACAAVVRARGRIFLRLGLGCKPVLARLHDQVLRRLGVDLRSSRPARRPRRSARSSRLCTPPAFELGDQLGRQAVEVVAGPARPRAALFRRGDAPSSAAHPWPGCAAR